MPRLRRPHPLRPGQWKEWDGTDEELRRGIGQLVPSVVEAKPKRGKGKQVGPVEPIAEEPEAAPEVAPEVAPEAAPEPEPSAEPPAQEE